MPDRFPREVTINTGGEERRVLVCLWGLKLAEEKSFDVSSLNVDPKKINAEGGSTTEMIELLWIGMLPFDEDLTRRDVGMMFTFKDLAKAESTINKILSRQLTDDVKEVIEGRREPVGDGEAGKSVRSSPSC